jgi:hypothetical protein
MSEQVPSKESFSWPTSKGDPIGPVWSYGGKKGMYQAEALRAFAHDLVDRIKEFELPVREAMKAAAGDGLNAFAYCRMLQRRLDGKEREIERLQRENAGLRDAMELDHLDDRKRAVASYSAPEPPAEHEWSLITRIKADIVANCFENREWSAESEDHCATLDLLSEALEVIKGRSPPPPGPVPKWKVGDMVKLGPRSAEFEIIGMRIVCDIGVSGKRVAVYDQDELLPTASKDARAESEREVFNIVHRGGLGPTKGEG